MHAPPLLTTTALASVQEARQFGAALLREVGAHVRGEAMRRKLVLVRDALRATENGDGEGGGSLLGCCFGGGGAREGEGRGGGETATAATAAALSADEVERAWAAHQQTPAWAAELEQTAKVAGEVARAWRVDRENKSHE